MPDSAADLPHRNFPVIPHDQTGACSGSVIPELKTKDRVELRCSECGTVLGEVDREILKAIVWKRNA